MKKPRRPASGTSTAAPTVAPAKMETEGSRYANDLKEKELSRCPRSKAKMAKPKQARLLGEDVEPRCAPSRVGSAGASCPELLEGGENPTVDASKTEGPAARRAAPEAKTTKPRRTKDLEGVGRPMLFASEMGTRKPS